MKKDCRLDQQCSKKEQANLDFSRELDAKIQLQNKSCKAGCSKR